jgi:hypothetical protein
MEVEAYFVFGLDAGDWLLWRWEGLYGSHKTGGLEVRIQWIRLSLPGIELRIPSRPSRNIITIPTYEMKPVYAHSNNMCFILPR